MVKKFKTFDPQLVFAEQTAGSAVVLTNEAKLSLYKKSQKSGISTDILEKVYVRGYNIWNESFGQTPEQFAFDRVNSFVAGGFAAQLDDDLINEKRGLWDNIHAKQNRIKNGSGEHMRKPGSKGAPTADALKNSQNEEAIIEAGGAGDVRKLSPGAAQEWREKHKLAFAKIKAAKLPPMSKDQLRQMAADAMKNTAKMQKEEKKIHTGKHFKNAETSEKQSHNPNDPDSRFDGTTSGKDVYTKATPGQVIKRVIKEIAIRNIKGEMINIKNQKFRGSDNKIHSAPPGKSSSSGGGGGSDES